jgi:hypothetical protein
MSQQDIGREFENEVHNRLFLHIKYTEILREKDVRSKYGIHNTCIDHMFEYNGLIICIQDKWEITPSPISKINHFIQCVTNINSQINKPSIGIYLSRVGITKPSKEAFLEQNRLNGSRLYFTNITFSEEDEEKNKYILIEKLFYLLHHEFNIYSYDDDDSLIMR